MAGPAKHASWSAWHQPALEKMGKGWITAIALAGKMGLTRARASSLLQSMKRKGLVEASSWGGWRRLKAAT